MRRPKLNTRRAGIEQCCCLNEALVQTETRDRMHRLLSQFVSANGADEKGFVLQLPGVRRKIQGRSTQPHCIGKDVPKNLAKNEYVLGPGVASAP